MAWAVALMIAVSLPSIRDEFFTGPDDKASMVELFEVNPVFEFENRQNPNHPENARTGQRRAFGTPVIYIKPNGDPEQF